MQNKSAASNAPYPATALHQASAITLSKIKSRGTGKREEEK